jgi:hypothetical protein
MLHYELEREVKNIVDWEKSIKKAKVRIGLWCHLVIIKVISTSYWSSVACVTDKDLRISTKTN